MLDVCSKSELLSILLTEAAHSAWDSVWYTAKYKINAQCMMAIENENLETSRLLSDET